MQNTVATETNLADKFVMYHNINIGKNYCNSLTFGLFEDNYVRELPICFVL